MPETPLIPRSVLFGNPERMAPQLSPDGRRLLFLAPADGVLAVWVQTVGIGDARVVAADAARPIRIASWSPDGAYVLYVQDAGGDENFHLFAADLAGGAPRDVTPFPGVRASIVGVDDDQPDTLLVALNERDRRFFDVHRLALSTGNVELDTENPGDIAAWTADADLRVRAAVRADPSGAYAIVVRDHVDSPWRVLAETPVEDGAPNVVAFTPDGSGLYAVTALDANAKQLVRYDIASGTAISIVADPVYDVAGVLVSRKTEDLIAARVYRDRADWEVIDPAYDADFEALRGACPGDFAVTICDAGDERWIVTYVCDDASPSYWSYDRANRIATKLFDAQPALAQYALATIEPVTIPARDGLALHGYLTLPVGVGHADLPLVLYVHGGPWARDVWGYNPYAQLLANRGYAVLQVNFRGSTGYGKAFLNAGDLQWAGAMRTDLLDAKDWAVAQGIADPARVAIFGGSYGGYATLTALAFTPDAFACGVDIVGPSNLNTLLASIPPYWTVLRGEFVRRMGEDEDFLNAQSPLFKADRITAPLLIGQGANDPRVKIAESDQIVAAMRANDRSVTYVVFEDEGHGFARPENNLRFTAAMEQFFAEHLGGRAEPPSDGESITAFLR
jgi:dipeptidyl aminopeptidase/acylaminoacyl peptidase